MIDLFAAGGALLLLDQWSKRSVQLRSADRAITWAPLIRIRRVTPARNFHPSGRSRVRLAVIWLVALGVTILLLQDGSWFQGRIALVGLGLAFGGAAGNLLDILRFGYVIDFIDLRGWPVFNVADVAIIAGLLMALWRPN